MKRKPKILCVCTMGLNRSKYLAKYLKNKGYRTRYGGIGHKRVDLYPDNPFKQEDVNWADIIILARKKHEPLLKKKYNIKNKRIIALEVTDSRRIVGNEHPEFRDMEFEEFQKKWTRPQLRRAIKTYLPL